MSRFTRTSAAALLCASGMAACVVLFALFAIPQHRPESSATRTTSPARIVSLIPAATEMLFAMGAADQLIAVGAYDSFPPAVERLPRVGGLLDPSVERILALQPDLVIVYDTQAELKRQLALAGIPIFRYVHQGLPDILETMRTIGVRVGKASAADAAASRVEQQLSEIKARIAQRPRPRTLVVFGREPGSLRYIEASGGYGFLHDVLQIAGGTDVLADTKRESVQLSAESILALAPDVIIELRYGKSAGTERLPAERQAWNSLPSVPAIRNNRVYLLVGDEFVVPGPRIGLAVERFARTLHPKAFAN